MDLSSGWGTAAMTLVQSTRAETTCLTLSAQQLAYMNAWRQCNPRGIQSRFSPLQGDWRYLMRSNTLFDAIIHHDWTTMAIGIKNIGMYASTVYRALRPHGSLVFQITTCSSLWNSDMWAWYSNHHGHMLPGSDGILTSVDVYVREFQSAGFTVAKVENISRQTTLQWQSWYALWLENCSWMSDFYGQRVFVFNTCRYDSC